MSSTEDFDARLGRKMATWRESKGVSQDSLAEQLKRDQSFVSKLERGQRRITVFELMCWATELDISLEVVIREVDSAWSEGSLGKSIWERERDD